MTRLSKRNSEKEVEMRAVGKIQREKAHISIRGDGDDVGKQNYMKGSKR